jgi:HTH-type transcriptional regulator, competence development regulator
MQPTPLGRELRRLRQGLGLRQRELASRISVSPTYICQLESGACPPPSENRLKVLAEVLQTDPDVLFALARRVPSDVIDALTANPELWPGIRQAAQN